MSGEILISLQVKTFRLEHQILVGIYIDLCNNHLQNQPPEY